MNLYRSIGVRPPPNDKREYYRDKHNSSNHVNSHVSVILLTGLPTGFDEIWIIGDTHFLAQARRILEQMKDNENFNNKTARGRLPFILDNFEVVFGTFHQSWCFTLQIIGGLNDLLAKKWRLPNYLYILFSNDQINESEILGDQVYTVLEHLFTNLNRSLIQRRETLPKKARRFKHTLVSVVKTVPRTEDQQDEGNFKNKRRAFNRALQKVAADLKWRSINIDALLPKEKTNFDKRGQDLSDAGFNIFWQFISDDLRKLETEQSQTDPHLTNPRRWYEGKPFKNYNKLPRY